MPGGPGQFVVAGGEAQLAVATDNPTGFSLFGTYAKTLSAFQTSGSSGYELAVRMRLESTQPGVVYGIYFFGCDAGPCATHHDELNIEIVTNYLQPGQTPRGCS